MDKLTQFSSRAVPIMNANIDTDIITPMNRLTSRTEKPLAHYAFEPLRYAAGDGDTGEPNPGFPLNDSRYAGAAIMICGENFGCGSSRESAPAALADLGFRCLIGSSFGDIFFNNCFQRGILPIVVTLERVELLADMARDGGVFELDLAAQTIAVPDGTTVAFEVNELRKRSLLEGLDDIELTLEESAEIAAFEASDRELRPWIHSL